MTDSPAWFGPGCFARECVVEEALAWAWKDDSDDGGGGERNGGGGSGGGDADGSGCGDMIDSGGGGGDGVGEGGGCGLGEGGGDASDRTWPSRKAKLEKTTDWPQLSMLSDGQTPPSNQSWTLASAQYDNTAKHQKSSQLMAGVEKAAHKTVLMVWNSKDRGTWRHARCQTGSEAAKVGISRVKSEADGATSLAHECHRKLVQGSRPISSEVKMCAKRLVGVDHTGGGPILVGREGLGGVRGGIAQPHA